MNQSKLKEIMREEGVTVKELFEACNKKVSESSIRRYTNGAEPKDSYKGKIKNAINKLRNKEYEIRDIWKI